MELFERGVDLTVYSACGNGLIMSSVTQEGGFQSKKNYPHERCHQGYLNLGLKEEERTWY